MLYDPQNIRIVMRDKTNPDGISEMSLAKYAEIMSKPENKKVVNILPGSACCDKWAAKGMIKKVVKELGNAQNKPLIGCLYFKDLGQGMPDEYYYRTADICAKEFFEVCLKNQLPAKDKNEYETFPSVKKAGAIMRRNMYFTHCYGSFMMESIDKYYQKRVAELGFMPSEQDIILKQSLSVEHNNISVNLGEYEPKLTHLQRETCADEKRAERQYLKASINEYIKQEPLADDEVLLVPLSENEYMSLTKQITKDGYKEHNGAQWEEYKSEAGEKEDSLCRGIMQHFILDNRPLENIENLSYNAYQNRLIDNLSYDELNSINEYGKEYGEDFHHYRQQLKAKTNLTAAQRD